MSDETPRLRDIRLTAERRVNRQQVEKKARELLRSKEIFKEGLTYVLLTRFDHLQHILTEACIPHIVSCNVPHELYPYMPNGVHLLTFKFHKETFEVSIDFIFSPITGNFLQFDIRLDQ